MTDKKEALPDPPKPDSELGKILDAVPPASNINVFTNNTIAAGRFAGFVEESSDKSNQPKAEKEYDILNFIYDFKPASRVVDIALDFQVEMEMIARDRMLIIDSYDYKVLLSAVTKFLNHEQFAELSKKRLNFDRGDKSGVGFLFQSLIYDVFKTSKNTLLTFFANASVACEYFMNQVFTNDFKAAVGEYQRILTETNSYIIFVINEPKFIMALNEKGAETFIERKHIPFLKFMLGEVYELKDASELVEIIYHQKKAGQWSGDEEVFYTEISRGLARLGTAEFKRIVVNDTKEKSELLYKNIVQSDKAEIDRLFEKKDDLIKCISFIAINFEGISVNEFNYLMQSMLADPEKKEVVPNPLRKDEMVEKKLLDRWDHDADLLLREVHIREVVNNPAEGRVVDFDKSGFRDSFKQEFYSTYTWYTHQQFNYLYFDEGLLFRSDVPYRIQENFIRMAADIATNEPDLYCQKLLIYTSFYIINQKAKIDITINPDEDDLELAFERYLKELEARKLEVEWQKQEALRKIGLLIAEMYKYENLRDRITQFFNLFIDYKLHDVVFFFVEYLRKVPYFDTLYWIKQLLNRGPSALKQDTYNLLKRYIAEDTAKKAYEKLRKIKEWYIDKEKFDAFSDNSGLCVFLDYMFLSVRKIEYKDYGKYPTQLHLLSTFDKAGDEEEVLDFIVEWFLHPKLAEASHAIDRLFGIEESFNFYADTLARLIVMVVTVFNGIEGKQNKNGSNIAAAGLGEKMISAIKGKADKYQVKNLKEGFRSWRDYYDANKKNENDGSKELRQIYFSISKAAAGLLNYFNKQ